MKQPINVVLGDWSSCRRDAAAVRYEVFVEEQQVPADIELDEEDAGCVHAVAYDPYGRAIGTGRLLPDGHIGRMAVRASHRGRGIGSQLLEALMDEARRRRVLEVVLSAQTRAIPFYEAHGFVANGHVYMDAGIEHVTMRHALTA